MTNMNNVIVGTKDDLNELGIKLNDTMNSLVIVIPYGMNQENLYAIMHNAIKTFKELNMK